MKSRIDVHTVITSAKNERIQYVGKLARRRFRDQERVFVAEGMRLVEEALLSGDVRSVFFCDRLRRSPRGEALIERILHQKDLCSYRCESRVLEVISNTETHQGVLAVVEQPTWDVADVFDSGFRVAVADGLQDPGNLGTLVRTVTAAGFDGLVLTEGTVDVYNPKVVRASMGAILQLPHVRLSATNCKAKLRSGGYAIVVADAAGGVPYYQAPLAGRVGLVIGNEVRGVSETLREAADVTVVIPQDARVESLNASVAAGILVYETVRQRVLE